jgi:dsDNA-binding SOS-regulon protein
VWTTKADQALAQLKDFLSKPPVLTAPRKKEQLLLYLAATTHVVSTAIVVERQEDGHAYPVRRPVRSWQNQRHTTNQYKRYSM